MKERAGPLHSNVHKSVVCRVRILVSCGWISFSYVTALSGRALLVEKERVQPIICKVGWARVCLQKRVFKIPVHKVPRMPSAPQNIGKAITLYCGYSAARCQSFTYGADSPTLEG